MTDRQALMVVRRATTVAALALLAGCGTATAGGGTAEDPTPTASTTAPSASEVPQVLADGDVVGASGRLVRVPGRPVQFCPPLPVAAVGYAAGKEPAPAGCDGYGVDVVGAHLTDLDQRREKDGAVEGWATLRGTYRDGTLTVIDQKPPMPDRTSIPDWSRPPCPRPDGGWTGDAEAALPDYQAFEQEHPGEVASLVLFRPTDSRPVLVLVVQHPDVVRAALPADPATVCIVPSRYTAAQIEAARHDMDALMLPKGGHGVWSAGAGAAESGQLLLTVEAAMVTEPLRSLVLDAPAGLVQVDPWLRPVDAS